MILLRNASLCLVSEGKSGGRGFEYRLAGFGANTAPANSPIGPIQPEWDLGYTKPSQNYKNQVTPSYWYERA